ncbi:hypothetical protein AX17_006564 [Amanita inopinata Kibby_2008]|nr:hypothetical protein AX17_006564 [Amanita inopinata Kibby_2008]
MPIALYSGSAFPATLAFQIRKLERETGGHLRLDAIATVIDAENFIGYEDTSPTAKMQASYTDIILINKWEHVSERALDIVLDHLNTLNDLTPKIQCQGRNGVDPDILFGLNSTQFLEIDHRVETGHDEVETITIYSGSLSLEGLSVCRGITKDKLQKALECLTREVIWRVKGYVRIRDNEGEPRNEVGLVHVLNWAFGRYDLVELNPGLSDKDAIKLTVMGERGEVRRASRRFAEGLGANIL